MTRARGLALAAALALAACESPVPPSASPATPPPSAAASFGELPRDAIRGNVVFSADTPDGGEDIFVLALGPVDGDRLRLTRLPLRELDPDLSPDGSRIAFRVNPEEGSDAADIWVMNADGTDARNRTADPSLNNWSPAWSPDGTRIAFASTREGGTLSIWTMTPDGTDLRRVTSGHGEYPDWSPDGSRIVYAAPRAGSSGRYDLWTIDAAGREAPQRVTSEGTSEFAPAWSPDGEWIAYQRDMGARWELWIVRPDGSGSQRVSPDGEDGVWAAWSPDGLLAWSGTQGLTFVDLDGGRRLSISPEPPGTNFLSWGR
jgi:Tol biopolymer transport system component